MSKLAPTSIGCPSCGAEQSVTLFDSLNGDRVPAQVELVLAGTFEELTCACGRRWRAEHTMLFSQYSRGVWIAMHPVLDRPNFRTLERGVELVLGKALASAPPEVAGGVRDVRPRLVFGQHMLSEAVRLDAEGIDAALLECAKLLTIRDDFERLIPFGPIELAFERLVDQGIRFGIHSLPAGDRIGEYTVPADLLEEATAHLAALQASYPELFDLPYVSATRYLLADLV